MSNLGWYQVMTTMAKKVGGPRNLFTIVLGSGAILGGTAVTVKRKFGEELSKKKINEEAAIVHTVKKDGRSNEGLVFKTGDKFKVLERDGDAALIEILHDSNNPYFVSAKFLHTISDYTIA